jgi:hypothetical protein
VWFCRNEVTHEKPLPTIEGSKRFLANYIWLLRDIKHTPTEALIKGKQTVMERTLKITHQAKPLSENPWTKPPMGWVKLTVEGSFRESDHLAGTGMALRDEEGRPIFSACRFISDRESPYEEERSACLQGLKLALEHSQLPVIVESDCAKLIEAGKSKSQDRSSCVHIVSEIRNLASQGRVCDFIKVERSQVKVNHCLTNYARKERRTFFWLGSGPENVLQFLEHDRLIILPAQ